MKKIQVDSGKQSLDKALMFVRMELENIGASADDIKMIHMVVDEIFVNISNYAYEDVGFVDIITDYEEQEGVFSLTFQDEGVPFDPLSYKGADTSLPLRERGPGGFGIMMVKNTMDEMKYEYRDGKNVLKLKKRIGE